MRPGRAAMHAALPLVGLAALAVIGAVRPPGAEPLPPSGGSGAVDPVVVVRVVTDGHPQLITLPAVHPAVVVTPRQVLTRPVARAASRRTVAGPVPVHVTAPRPVSSPAPRPATTSSSYPYASDGSGGEDPWGFTKRQCVSYVAWRLADAGRPIDNASQGWGSALDWDQVARGLGYTVTTRPTVGAVAQWHADETSSYYGGGSSTANGTFVAGSYGHVAWVTKVYSDGSVQLAQYNGYGDRTYSTMRAKAPRFLLL